MRIKVPVVPASFFGMVIGLAGLGTAWRWAHQVWGLPAVVGEAIIWLSIAVWVGLTILYVAKWLVARDDASAEVADPVQCCEKNRNAAHRTLLCEWHDAAHHR
jgi:tellurite resistance protein